MTRYFVPGQLEAKQRQAILEEVYPRDAHHLVAHPVGLRYQDGALEAPSRCHKQAR